MIKNAKEIISGSPLSKTLEHYMYTLRKEGSASVCKCPNCGEERKGKGLKLFKDDKKGKCYQCDETLSALNVVAIAENLNIKSDYETILVTLASIHNLHTEYEQTKPKPKKKKKESKPANSSTNPTPALPLLDVPASAEQQGPTGKISFRDQQLAASGITDEAQYAWYIDIDKSGKKSRVQIPLFTEGSKDDAGNIIPGDDMVIRKIDLDRKRRTFYRPKKQIGQFYEKPYDEWRIRYKIPEHHPDKYGKPRKYDSPFGSTGSPFHPEPILNAFEKGIQFDTYHIDEGEKKSTKRNMHGMLGSGAMGIHNLGENSAIHPDFDRIVKHNGVKNVVFTLDADCFDLPADKTKPIDSRARSFVAAVIKYKQYFYAMTTQGIDLNIFIAWINKNDKGEKGVDDLLAGTLAGKEELLKRDYETAMATQPLGEGKYVTVKNITSYSEQKIYEIFHLASREQYILHHKQELLDRRDDIQKETNQPVIFCCGSRNTKWALTEHGEISLAQPLSEEEIFWKQNAARGGGRYSVQFDKFDLFLKNNGIGRVLTSNPDEKAEYKLVRAFSELKVVKDLAPQEVRDLIYEYLKEIGLTDLYSFFREYDNVITDKKINESPLIDIPLLKHGLTSQYLFFQNGFWFIDSRGIVPFNLQDSPGFVSPSELIKHTPTFVQDPLVKFTKVSDLWKSEFTDKGKRCHVLQFLWNASNFQWKETKRLKAAIKAATDPTEKQKLEAALEAELATYNTEISCHLINKMTAIGYLCHSVFNPAIIKMVIAMDGKDNSLRDSHGRSGKSLIMDIISEVVRVVRLNGKKKNIADDDFALQEVTLDTKVIAYDDLDRGFDVEHLFSMVQGNTKMRGVYKGSVTIPKEKTPKFFASTNYSISGEGGSYQARQFFILFSDYYQVKHVPKDDFDNMFFVEWEPENEQWNLFFRMIAECIRLYFEHGLIDVNDGLVKTRQMRGKIGEAFLDFINDYVFNTIPESMDPVPPNPYGIRIERKPMQDKFFEEYPNERKFTNALRFREKLGWWAEYMGLEINKHKPKFNKKGLTVESQSGGRETAGGKEWFTFTPKDENLLIPDAPQQTAVPDQQEPDAHLYDYRAANDKPLDDVDF